MGSKKRKGNVMVVAALLLVILPSLMILVSIGGSSIKILKRNINYHQSYLQEESIEIVVKARLIEKLEEQEVKVRKKDGKYYIIKNEEIEIRELLDKDIASIKEDFGVKEIEETTHYIKKFEEKELPYVIKEVIKIEYSIDKEKYKQEYEVEIQINQDKSIKVLGVKER